MLFNKKIRSLIFNFIFKLLTNGQKKRKQKRTNQKLKKIIIPFIALKYK